MPVSTENIEDMTQKIGSGSLHNVLLWKLISTEGSQSFPTHPVVSEEVLQLDPVALRYILTTTQLKFGQKLFQGGVAVPVPASWVTRAPLHNLLL